MKINLPYKIRLGLYIVTGLSGPVMVYLLAKGWIGTLEMGLYTAEMSFVSILAALNVTPDQQ